MDNFQVVSLLAALLLTCWPGTWVGGAMPAFTAAEARAAMPHGSWTPCACLGILAAAREAGKTGERGCPPTAEDALGPFYKPNAPVRAKVGEGYVLTGAVKSSRDCAPLAGAKIEFWLAGPDGNYDDAHRATMFADQSGAYRFESNFPPPYSFRPPHIHIKVSAPGFKTLVTQHYPEKGRTGATLDLILAR